MFARVARQSLTRQARFTNDGIRRDLFGYEQSSEVGPWNTKISQVPFWNEAGEIMVEMNQANCPPDLSTYKEVLKTILRCPSKYDGGLIEGESKFCAMMDALEEMEHRNKIKTDADCWVAVMEAAIEAKDFRAGRALAACIPGVLPQNLIDANEKIASAAEANGTAFPAELAKQPESLFDIEIKAN